MSAEGTARDAAVVSFGDDRLLLEECSHRVLNEIASAIAAVRLARSAKGPDARERLLSGAIDRLEGFARSHRLLSGPTPPLADVSRGVDELVRALAASRPETRLATLRLSLPEIWIDGATARRTMLVAAELVWNAMRHALSGRSGMLDVAVSVERGDVVLRVADDGPGLGVVSDGCGTGLGTPIVRELVARGNGATSCGSGAGGTEWIVRLPVDPAALRSARP